MLQNPTPETKAFYKNPLIYSSTVILIAVMVIGWIFYNRWDENRRIDRNVNAEKEEKQSQRDRGALEQMGGKKLEIQTFYANPKEVRRGDTAQLCYGVANAKTVKLEPQSNPVWPSYARCVDVAPKKDTTYTLTIEDGAGNTATQTVEVKVR